MEQRNKNITKLREVSISGYKSISSNHPLTIELGNINIFLGANGSGKSNIISFFKMLNSMMSGSFQLFIEKAGTSQVFLHYGAKYTTNIKGKLCFESNTHTDHYSFQLTYATPDRLIITSEEVEWGIKGNKPQTIQLSSDFKESSVTPKSKNETVRIIHRILTNCKVYQFHDSSSESPIRQSSPIDTANYLQAEGNNLASFLYYNSSFKKDINI